MNKLKIFVCGAIVCTVLVPTAYAAVNLCVAKPYVYDGAGVSEESGHVIRVNDVKNHTRETYRYFYACGAQTGTWDTSTVTSTYTNFVDTISTPPATGTVGCYARIVSPVLSKWAQVIQYDSLAACMGLEGCGTVVRLNVSHYNGLQHLDGLENHLVTLSY